jgi:hypothetical protein
VSVRVAVDAPDEPLHGARPSQHSDDSQQR